ncbi:FAD-dependent oxidoreductase [Anaerobacillus sp. CMMVII]|uniref:FAD-dependent oxidoreductase n=1 Tax=Anaerobacillus sp. CMMVII TaxID=2755588 RepID=UPI0021B7DCF9|nr:FAD/NAD(P)-binding protein [Anaerobacillus sp. CMMVII]MCT8136811.1 FAD-dependent oxidoreductase [Anaerobacillus sp. CMMVII]
MKKWLIIGGGIQGCTMASYLRKRLGINETEMTIVDLKDKPLMNWRLFTKRVGMSYLRSPSIHHLDPSPFALEKFAKQNGCKDHLHFHAPYDRPDLQLFNQHCDEIFEQIDIEKSWVQGRVVALTKSNHHWIVTLADGTDFHAENVVIAIGLSEQLNWPEWAKEGKKSGANIAHVFDDKEPTITDSVVIVGGGISAAHAALQWSKLRPNKVTLLPRHPLTVHQFDSDPGWLGPKYMNKFSKIGCYEERRKVIKTARHPGSLPSELKTEIERHRKLGTLQVKIDEVIEIQRDTLLLKSGGDLTTSGILLATGFEQKPPGMDWLQTLIQTYCLPCASCGYPIPKPSLEWEEGLYLLGALAELQLGPVARNISGARRGAERIISSF